MNDSLWPEKMAAWLDRLEGEAIADIAEDAIARGDPDYLLVSGSDDIDEVAAAVDECATRRKRAEAAMQATDTGDEADYPAFEVAAAEFDRLDNALALLRGRLDELEEAAAFDEAREMRRAYWHAVL